MVQFEELLLKLQALKPEIDDLSDALGMKGMLSEIQQLELKATEPGFWDDVEKSQKVLQRTGSLKGKVEAYEGLVAKYEDTHALIESLLNTSSMRLCFKSLLIQSPPINRQI